MSRVPFLEKVASYSMTFLYQHQRVTSSLALCRRGLSSCPVPVLFYYYHGHVFSAPLDQQQWPGCCHVRACHSQGTTWNDGLAPLSLNLLQTG
jgi:hypothetical protein